MLLFMVVVYMVFWANAEAADKIPSYEASQAYKEKAVRVIDVLLKTPGDPADWEGSLNLSGVSSIGLAREANVIDRQKLMRLLELPASQVARLLGLGKESFKIEVLDGVGRTIYSYGPADSPHASIERLAMLEGDPVVFRFSLS
jgi:hypothetical protein